MGWFVNCLGFYKYEEVNNFLVVSDFLCLGKAWRQLASFDQICIVVRGGLGRTEGLSGPHLRPACCVF